MGSEMCIRDSESPAKATVAKITTNEIIKLIIIFFGSSTKNLFI